MLTVQSYVKDLCFSLSTVEKVADSKFNKNGFCPLALELPNHL
jgi:hypothetical protein